ncbi:diguanylate cyclase [Vibrio maerlii]|uniref:sensor domain-containing diguanylate cyclase n=1 Tax=Vibrio maerlii TaxID=2231648 RepID=UPI000E3E1491|nr:diguanylate cyclase [Vibrio maerlii]
MTDTNTDYWALSLLPNLMQCHSTRDVEEYLAEIQPKLKTANTSLSSIYLRYCDGFFEYKKGNYLVAIETLTEVVELAKRGQHITVQLYASHTLGVMLFRLGRYDDAVAFLTRGLKAKELGDDFLLSHVYNMFGNIEFQLGNYQGMLDNFTKARDLDINESQLARHVILTNYPQAFDYLGDAETAFTEYEKAREILERNPSDFAWYLYYGAFAQHLAKQSKYELALELYNKALELGSKISDRFQVAADFLEYCEIALDAEHYTNLETYANDGVQVAREVQSSRLLDGFIGIYNQLAELHKSNPEKRMQHLETSLELSLLTSKLKSESEKRYLSKIYELQQDKVRHANAISLQDNLSLMGSMGEYLTTCSDIAELIDRLYQDINLFMRADTFAIGIYDSSEHKVRFDHYIDDGKHVDSVEVDCSENHSITARCVQTRQPYFTNDYDITAMAKHLGCEVADLIRTSSHTKTFYSLMFLPIIIKDELLGVVTVQSKLKHNYQDYHFNLIEQLTSYIGIGLTNIFQRQELINQRAEFEKLSVTDPLTGVYNRQALNQQFASHRYSVSLQPENSFLGLLLVDIDHFKQFNDTYGHVAGDDLLTRLSKLFKAHFNSRASLIRYGGDEFLVLIELEDQAMMTKICGNLLADLHSLDLPHRSSPHYDRVTLSIGGAFAHASQCERALPTLIHDADMALYKAKEQGRATYVIE